MKIAIKKFERRTKDSSIFSPAVSLFYALVEIDGHSFAFSQLEDETEFYCDSHFGPNMYPYFSHGVGSRSCLKSVATGELKEKLELEKKLWY
jgi:hypothetical protein